MDVDEIPYWLERARAHRSLERSAAAREVRCVHRRFVRNYQHILLDIRRARSRRLSRPKMSV